MEHSRITTLLLAGCLAVAGCGDDDDPSSVTVPVSETSATPTSSRETTTTEDPAAAVEAAFYAQWDAFVEITSDPDVNNPLIDEHFTGEAKESLLDVVSELMAEGQAARLPEDPNDFEPRAVDVRVESSSTAVVLECTVDGAVIYDVRSGQVINDNVSTYEARNEFILDDGKWKLASSHPAEEGESTCDEL